MPPPNITTASGITGGGKCREPELKVGIIVGVGVGSIVALVMFAIFVFLRWRNHNKQWHYQSLEHAQKRFLEIDTEKEVPDMSKPTPDYGDKSLSSLDRNSSVRSVMTLPSWKTGKQIMRSEKFDETLGALDIPGYHGPARKEQCRKAETDALYQFRQARRTEVTDRETKR